MSRDIIDEDDGFGILINTFWNGQDEEVQITFDKGYHQMSRTKASKFFALALIRLRQQVTGDLFSPPWWQAKAKEKSEQVN